MFLAAYSIIFGIETAKGFKWLKKRFIRETKFFSSIYSWDLDQYNTYLTGTVVLLLILGVVWGVCIAFTKKQFYSDHSHAELLLGCIVGPFGVWIRWFLARLNGRGLGKKPVLRWVPFGTLAANILAAAVMAALATLKKVVSFRNEFCCLWHPLSPFFLQHLSRHLFNLYDGGINNFI